MQGDSKMKKLKKLWLCKLGNVGFITLLLVSNSVFAQEYSKETLKLLNSLEEKFQLTVTAIQHNELQAGNKIEGIHAKFNLYKQSVSDLGLILDVDSEINGFKIIAIEKNSISDKANIEVDSLIVAINGLKINSQNTEPLIQQLQSLSSGDTLLLDIEEKESIQQYMLVFNKAEIPAATLTFGDFKKASQAECLTLECKQLFEQYRKIADGSDLTNRTLSRNLLATMYFYGYGTEIDVNMAIEYYEKSIGKRYLNAPSFNFRNQQVSKMSLYQLGYIFIFNESHFDAKKSINYLTIAAKAKHNEAIFLLSLIYATDEFGLKDTELSAYWLKKAYDRGSIAAIKTLKIAGLTEAVENSLDNDKYMPLYTVIANQLISAELEASNTPSLNLFLTKTLEKINQNSLSHFFPQMNGHTSIQPPQRSTTGYRQTGKQ